MRRLSRGWAFGLLAGTAALAATGYVAAASRTTHNDIPPPPATTRSAEVVVDSSRGQVPLASRGTERLLTSPRVADRKVLFRVLDRDHAENWGHVAIATVGKPDQRRLLDLPACERVYFAGGRGVCLAKGGGFATLYSARILDKNFKTVHTIPLGGVPSRARISSDGRYGATTTFVAGHSYATPGTFSTQTQLIDLAKGKVIANLERFRVTRGDSVIDKPDMNFWGVTFAHDSNTFYATVATGGKTYLIRGDIRARTARVLHTNVECPSLSPDGTRLAYKKRVLISAGSPSVWHLYVLDLRTMHETPIAEPQAIDDQVEWLGNKLLVYRDGEEVHAAAADGSSGPVRLLAQADSPAVLS